MPCRDTVHTTRESQRQDRHLVPRIGGTGIAESHKLVARDTHRIPERSCHLLDLLGGEHVVSRRHRRVRRKHAAGADLILCGREGDSFLKQLAQPFDVHERRMAFVQMPDLRIDAERAERSEEHTSELQSLAYLVCRLLLEKKKKKNKLNHNDMIK